MSAIFGIFNFNKQPVSRDDLERMNRVLKPYGPEGGGIWQHGHIGLGQCQMHFTPEDKFEQQPLISSDGKRVLVFSGRIDNRKEIISTLGISLSEASVLPDSALILRAHEYWGYDCVSHLIGGFAFAIWNVTQQHLFIVRSPIYAPPLFYYDTPQALAFAIMRKGLFALPHVPRALDEQVLADYLAWVPIDPDLGFYREIKRLPTGHALHITSDGYKVKRFWELDLAKTIRYPNDDDYVDAFNDLFTQVVDDQLRSLSPMGIMMSGGLDSSSVAAVAAPLLKTRGERLAAYTEVPRPGFDEPIVENRYADETPYVQAVAAMYDNLELNLIRTDGQVYLDGLDDFFNAAEVPFRNAANRVYIEAILKTAQAQGIRALLSGGQGNLTISWDGGGLFPELLLHGQWMRAIGEARALAKSGFSRSMLRALIGQGLMPILPHAAWLTIERLRRRNDPPLKADPPWAGYSAVNPAFAAEQRVAERAAEKDHNFHFRPPADPRFIRRDVITNAGNLFDGLFFGYQNLYGTTGLDPTTDQRMVEFCLNLPEDQYLKDGIPKRLIRRAMAERLPEAVLWNKKRGLQCADWFERLAGNLPKIRTALARMEGSDLARQVVDLPRLHHLVDAMGQSDANAQALMRDYRGVLDWGLMTGSFITWFEEK